jgi:hypothetical protein
MSKNDHFRTKIFSFSKRGLFLGVKNQNFLDNWQISFHNSKRLRERLQQVHELAIEAVCRFLNSVFMPFFSYFEVFVYLCARKNIKQDATRKGE